MKRLLSGFRPIKSAYRENGIATLFDWFFHPLWKYGDKRRGNHGRRKPSHRASTSLPDVTAIAAELEEKLNGPVVVDAKNFFIPAGLSPLHTLPQGKFVGRCGSTKRPLQIMRPPSPKSLVASASAFESVEGSDEEDNLTTDSSKLENGYLHSNGNIKIATIQTKILCMQPA